MPSLSSLCRSRRNGSFLSRVNFMRASPCKAAHSGLAQHHAAVLSPRCCFLCSGPASHQPSALQQLYANAAGQVDRADGSGLSGAGLPAVSSACMHIPLQRTANASCSHRTSFLLLETCRDFTTRSCSHMPPKQVLGRRGGGCRLSWLACGAGVCMVRHACQRIKWEARTRKSTTPPGS